MITAVIGGSGRLGSAVAAVLKRRGHDVRALSRSSPEHPVDLATGAGLDAALAGAEAVVNAANDPRGGDLKSWTERLLVAESAAGVRHHVEIGVVGADRVPLGYYRAKSAQEQVVRAGPVPWTIVRSTQFHEFVAQALASAADKHVLPGGRVPMEPVAAADLARAVAEISEGNPRYDVVTVAGPGVEQLGELTRAWKRKTGARALVIPVPGVHRTTRALRSGALTAERVDVRGKESFATWLETHT